jgi:hypothetical protein
MMIYKNAFSVLIPFLGCYSAVVAAPLNDTPSDVKHGITSLPLKMEKVCSLARKLCPMNTLE